MNSKGMLWTLPDHRWRCYFCRSRNEKRWYTCTDPTCIKQLVPNIFKPNLCMRILRELLVKGSPGGRDDSTNDTDGMSRPDIMDRFRTLGGAATGFGNQFGRFIRSEFSPSRLEICKEWERKNMFNIEDYVAMRPLQEVQVGQTLSSSEEAGCFRQWRGKYRVYWNGPTLADLLAITPIVRLDRAIQDMEKSMLHPPLKGEDSSEHYAWWLEQLRDEERRRI